MKPMKFSSKRFLIKHTFRNKNHSVLKMISHLTPVNSKTFHHLVYCLAENSRKVKLMVIIGGVPAQRRGVTNIAGCKVSLIATFESAGGLKISNSMTQYQ